MWGPQEWDMSRVKSINKSYKGLHRFFKIAFLLSTDTFNNEKVTYIKSKLLDIHSFASKSYTECQKPPGEM